MVRTSAPQPSGSSGFNLRPGLYERQNKKMVLSAVYLNRLVSSCPKSVFVYVVSRDPTRMALIGSNQNQRWLHPAEFIGTEMK